MKFLKDCAVVGLVLAFGAMAQADMSTLTLSTHSSDETPASALSATLKFTVDDVLDTLTLKVTNDTPQDGSGYNINELYFNANLPVTGLSDPGVAGWTFHVGPSQDTKADGFGLFDFSLLDGQGENDPSVIMPGGMKTFVFNISPFGGDFSAFDFTGASSTGGFFAAAKFVSGPDTSEGNDDSAYGAVVPAPGAVLLGAMGLGMVGWVRRRLG